MNPFLSFEVQQDLILASASPRRREILDNLGFEFEVFPSSVDEDEVIWTDPVKVVRLLSELKAVDVQKSHPLKTIIAADTTVVCDGEVLAKPAGRDDAVKMLETLSGRMHQVITGVVLISPPNIRFIEEETTDVFFRKISSAEISEYIDTGEPFDKAGAYAIQGYASLFVERVEGCFYNVVGLPVPRLFRMFRKLEKVILAGKGQG
ncbi:MAG: septum formation inhibitor Maf [Candidatus Krumholzibacteriota bacterium]|nr:septum formation inhibitor Maf [Candidatus Krumholzibacteriota bacterium]